MSDVYDEEEHRSSRPRCEVMSVHDAVVRSFDDACRALIERDGVEAYKRLHGALLHLSHSIVTCDEVARGETQVCPCVAAIGLFVLENVARSVLGEILSESRTLGQHWYEVAMERIAAGEPERDVFADYGYHYRDGSGEGDPGSNG